MSKINSVNDLQRLMESLGAKKEKGNGWASWTIDCGPGRLVHTDLSGKLQATSNKRQATSSLTDMGIYSKDKPARREVLEARRSTVRGSVPCQHDGQKKGHKNES